MCNQLKPIKGSQFARCRQLTSLFNTISKIVCFFLILYFIILPHNNKCFAQCGSATPTFIVDLTTTSSPYWISPDTARNDTCCGSTNPDKCVKFIITLPVGALGIVFNIYSGAVPSGSLYYQVACGPMVTVGTNICLVNQGPHIITFCKPGNNQNRYIISAYPFPKVSGAIAVNEGCKGILHCFDYLIPTIKWNSIYPGSYGSYNNYLSCSSACDSTIVTAKPGYPPYIDFQVGGQPSGGCIIDTVYDTVRVYFNSTLRASIQPDSPTICFGAISTTITAHGSGGTPPYRFVWSTSDTSSVLNVDTGIYILTVHDTSNCPPAYDTVEVTAFSSTISANAGADLLSCDTFVVLAGSVTAASGGKWVGGNGVFSSSRKSLHVTYYPTATELVTGYVNLMLITTGNGTCPPDSDFVQVRFRKFSDTINSDIRDVSCFGGSNASILLKLSGQTAPYSYLWSTKDTTVGINNVDTGMYIVTVTDSGGCNRTVTFSINQPPALSLSNTSLMVSCFGGNDGRINLSINGGVPPYSYNWSNKNRAQNLNGLSAGIFSVHITDSHFCTIYDTIVITQPLPLSLTATVKNVSCFNGNNGSILTNVSGGTSPYKYLWSNADTFCSPSGFPAGQHILKITDSKGCILYDTSLITQPPSLIINGTIRNACKNGNNGAIDITVGGGIKPYTYRWSNSANTQDLQNIPKGQYLVTITDLNGCKLIDTFVIQESTVPLSSSIIPTYVRCYGESNGAASALIIGGTPQYSFKWSSGDTTCKVSDLPAGTYKLMITDAWGCKDSVVTTINQPQPLVLNAQIQNVKCNGLSDGKINLIISGGTKPYKGTWSTGDTGVSICNKLSANYSAFITDLNGCSITYHGFITQPPKIVYGHQIKNVNCFGGQDGTIYTNLTGGTPGYKYLWSNGDTIRNLVNLSAGYYYLIITESNGCKTYDTIYLDEPDKLLLKYTKKDEKCKGDKDGNINTTISGGVKPYRYLWNTMKVSEDIYNLSEGTYLVTVTDSHGCELVSPAVQIYTNPLPTPTIQPDDKITACLDEIVEVFVMEDYAEYTWSNGEKTKSINVKDKGSFYAYVTDENGCKAQTDILHIDRIDPSIWINLDDEYRFCSEKGPVTLSPGPYTEGHYFWQPTGETTPTISVMEEGTYILIYDTMGCSVSDTTKVIEVCPPLVFVPNAITPNGNGVNDVFRISALNVESLRYNIFDRWGTIIFRGKSINDAWDGTYNGKAVVMDTYGYVIFYNSKANGDSTLKGTITVLY